MSRVTVSSVAERAISVCCVLSGEASERPLQLHAEPRGIYVGKYAMPWKEWAQQVAQLHENWIQVMFVYEVDR